MISKLPKVQTPHLEVQKLGFSKSKWPSLLTGLTKVTQGSKPDLGLLASTTASLQCSGRQHASSAVEEENSSFRGVCFHAGVITGSLPSLPSHGQLESVATSPRLPAHSRCSVHSDAVELGASSPS